MSCHISGCQVFGANYGKRERMKIKVIKRPNLVLNPLFPPILIGLVDLKKRRIFTAYKVVEINRIW